MTTRDVGEYVALGFITVVLVLCAYLMFLWVPVYVYADMKCAEMGYPKAKTTVNLKSFCMNLDGSVKMEKLK